MWCGFPGGASAATGDLQLDTRGLDLAAAIANVAEAAGLQVFYTSDLVAGLSAPPLDGRYTVRQALGELLRQTSLEYAILEGGTLVLRPRQGARNDSSSRTDKQPAARLSRRKSRHDAGAVEEGRTIAHVIVEGRKRAAALLSTPDSISALTGEWLDRLPSDDLMDVYRQVPGLFVIDRGPYRRKLFVRGIQNDVDTGGGTVGIYVDDLPVSTIGRAELYLFDIDRIEVLRGPQGTLYGANSMTGAVKYVPTQPHLDRFEGLVNARLSATRNGGVNRALDAMLNLPLEEQRAALRLVAYAREDSGFVQHRFGGMTVPPDPGLPGDAFYPGSPPVSARDGFELPPIERRHSNAHRVSGGRLAVAFAPHDALQMRLTAFTEHGEAEDLQAHQPDQLGELKNGFDILMPMADRIDGLSLVIERAFERYDLYATTGLVRSRLEMTEPFAGEFPAGLTPPGTELLSFDDRQLLATELRLVSKNLQRADWLLGLFYMDMDSRVRQLVRLQLDRSNLVVDDLYPQTERQVAAFGEFSWHLTPSLTATIGARLFRVEQSSGPSTRNVEPAAPILPPRGSDGYALRFNDTVDNYRFNLAWGGGEDLLLYAQAAQGFRVGGVNLNPTRNALVPPAFGSDDLWSYELGAKRSFGHWGLEATAYYLDWSDVQTRVFVNGAGFNLNAGQAHVEGLELSLYAQPIPGLEWTAALSMLDARLDDPEPDGNFPTGSEGRPGDRLPGVPRIAGAMTTQYAFPMRSDRQWFVAAGLSYVGSSRAEFRGPRAGKFGGYALLDLTLGFSVGPWTTELFARNALDRRADLAITHIARDQRTVVPNQPRTVGLSLTRGF